MLAIQAKSALSQKSEKIRSYQESLINKFNSCEEKIILSELQTLSNKYLGEVNCETIEGLSTSLIIEIDRRIAILTPEITRRAILQQILDLKLPTMLKQMNASESNLIKELDPLLNRRIEVLEKAKTYVLGLATDAQASCPVCGREISSTSLKAFVSEELTLLTKERKYLNDAKSARRALSSSLEDALRKMENLHVDSWLQDQEQGELLAIVTELRTKDFSNPDEDLDSDTGSNLLLWLPRIEEHLASYINSESIGVKDLINDKERVQIALDYPALFILQKEVESVNCILRALDECVEAIRSEIKTRTKNIIDTISSCIQIYWSEIHPDEPIESIKLYSPEDKSMDISLKFFGKEQPTPRLTLSEGHRNSLGLCVFLAMASLDDSEDKPIIMDDIVSSLDREHRASLASLFVKYFSHRQLIILTHDSEWFRELKDRLPENQYKFLKLKPWRMPEEGVCVTDSKGDFDDARSLLNTDSNCAANRARAIMDYRLAKACENLRLPMVYKSGDRNDHRTCYDFMTRILADSKRCLTVVNENGEKVTERQEEIIADWSEALTLLKSWGNRASHSGSSTKVESGKLIDVCEKACNDFKCPSCEKYLWFLADPSSPTPTKFRCHCGKLGWKN